jgi:hypothetical protein
MAQPQFTRDGTTWYVSDGLIWDKQPVGCRRDPSHPLECSSKLFLYNPNRRAAAVTVRCYHIDRAPTAVKVRVPAGRVETVELAALPEIPHNQSFWIAIESNLPVLPQAVHEDYTGWDPVPDSLVAVAPYPGPLTGETKLVFPDCFNMAPHPPFPWYEQETLTLLNPNQQPVRVRVQYLFRVFAGGAEETVEIPAERVAQLDVWARAPRPIDELRGAPVRMDNSYEYAVHLDATGPIAAQTTRRARWVGRSDIIGSRSTMGFPLRARKRHPWYYPGGEIVDYGVLPRATPADHPLSQCDNTWNLLFLHNLAGRAPAHATVTFHKPDGSHTTSQPLEVPPLKSALHCLHAAPWLGTHTRVGQPYAMTVTADQPVVPEICGAEFEMWSQVMPGGMTAVNFYPGPLADERTWWLGIGRAGGADDANVEWTQSYHLFNPGAVPVQVTLSFLGLPGGARSRPVSLAPGAVVRVQSTEIEGLPRHQPFAVRADGDGPFCAQVFGRTFTRGLPGPRATSSFLGVPMRLGEE